MSRTTRLRGGLIAATALAALPAAAQADTVTDGHLDWTQFNTYVGGTERTWLGYVTGPGPQLANGSATPQAPATGPTVDPNSPRGATEDSTTVFPSTSGTYDPNTGVGTVELDGGIEFAAPAPPVGHGILISVDEPEVVLNGLTGQLFASGKNGATTTYDRSAPLYDLDLSDATVTLKADGSRVLSGIVPSLATVGTAFPGNYAVGAGPERTPNTFGSFALTLRVKPDEVRGPQGETGAAGATGATGAVGPIGPAGAAGRTTTIRSVVAILAKAPYKGTTTRRVTVYNSRNKKIATGTLKGRTLKVTLADTVTTLSGTVKVKATGAKSSTKVKIPS
ncbi:MAG TPA: HtaA domain-containing protein [Baekduia sp.]